MGQAGAADQATNHGQDHGTHDKRTASGAAPIAQKPCLSRLALGLDRRRAAE
jgi:hypothetical protein